MAKSDALAGREVKPEVTCVIERPGGGGLAGARARAHDGHESAREDRYERMDESFHQRLREGFLTIARNAPERCVVIDTARTVDQVARVISVTAAERLIAP